MVNASRGQVASPPERRTCGVSLVLRDMGNGVTRLLHYAVVAEVPPKEFFEVFGPLAVPVPLTDRLSDAMAFAASSLDLDPDREYVGGVMRPLTEDITEFLLW